MSYDALLKEEYHTARKEYSCNACNFIEIQDIRNYLKLTISEWRAIITARNNGWKIKKGERYLYQVAVCDGDFCVLRSIPDIHDICIKHDLYPDN